jgi:hypothetical protein
VTSESEQPLTELHIDMQRIKPAVLKEVEARLGHALSDLLKPGRNQAEALWALAYAYGRRVDPALTWEQAGEIDVFLDNAPVPPTSAAG